MRIAIEASWAMGQPSGVGYYLIYLLQSLAELDKENEYYLLHYHAEWTGPDFGENFTPVSYRQGPATFSILFNLNRVLRELNVDLYHATAGTGVSHFKHPCPVVTTVHDLFRFTREDKSSFWQKTLFKWQFAASLKNSDHFICNSEFTQDELCLLKGVDKTKTTVTHLAACVVPRKALTIDKRDHLLFLGGLEKRKEPFFLLQVYHEALKQKADLPKLYFVGPDRGKAGKLQDYIQRHSLEKNVELTGYVSEDRKDELLSKAKLCLMPSSFEGFGIPLLEAQIYGIPVIASDIKIFREVVGKSAMLLALEESLWVEALLNLDASAELRTNYLELAAENLKNFTWELCAQKTLSIYQELSRESKL